MRSLLVAHDVPWPSLGGGLVRLARIVDAMSAVTDLDLFVLHDRSRSTLVLPATVAVQRSTSVDYPRSSSRIRWRLDWVAHRGVPLEVIGARADHAPRRALREWSRPPYDVVWFSTASAYEWMGRPDLGPTIVDLDNLEDVKARLRAELMADERRSSGASLSFRSRLARYQVRLNGNDWRRFQESVAGQVERVVFASELDASRSGLSNVTVIPNTYPRPTRPAGGTASGGAPVLLFQGDF